MSTAVEVVVGEEEGGEEGRVRVSGASRRRVGLTGHTHVRQPSGVQCWNVPSG